MSISLSNFLPHTHSHSFPKPKTLLRIRSCSTTIPARDRVIDFGRHKGRMLGTLPSTYLKWVSSNLRARDFEHWARLADVVLSDPVYQDRLQWEFVQKVLNGDVSSSSTPAVSSLVEISERFGWDNEDKLAWKKVNFELLGTSNGGRIPRIKYKGPEVKKVEEKEVAEGRGERGEDQRRERARLKTRRSKGQTLRSPSQSPSQSPGIRRLEEEGGVRIGAFGGERREKSPLSFPGREGLLRRVMDAKGKRPTF